MFNSTTNLVKNHWKRQNLHLFLRELRLFFPTLWVLQCWKAGGNTDLLPIAQASQFNDCSYKARGKSVSAALEFTEGYNTTSSGVLYCAPPFPGGIAGIQAESRRLVGIWWEYFLGESPPKFHLDWEWFPPNSHHSHQIHLDPGGSKSSQDPPKFQVESARNPGIPGGIHLES